MGRGALTGPDPIADAVATGWPGNQVALAVAVCPAESPHGRTSIVERIGPQELVFPLASVSKVLTATAVLVAVQEETLTLDDPAGPPGSTIAHLLAHASGLGPEGGVVAAPGRRRIYSNRGFEALGDALAAAAEMPFATYVEEAVLEPLGLSETAVEGSPARGFTSTAADMAALAAELLQPRLLDPATTAMATEVAFAGLDGVLPGFGTQRPNDWGLGFEVRGGKGPHWTGTTNSPATFGHFGQSGTFLWVDPVAGVACTCLGDRAFGPWAALAWPALSDAVLATHRPQKWSPSADE